MKSIGFTKREKIVLIVLGILTQLVFILPQQVITDYEMLWLFFIVLPLGILIITDPERRK